MKFIAFLVLAPLALAGCMPALDPESATSNATEAQSAADAAANVVVASTFQAPAFAPLPAPRPDFEGVTPASRALGAVVADARQVDDRLEAEAAAPRATAPQTAYALPDTAGTPQPQVVAFAPSQEPAQDPTQESASARPPTQESKPESAAAIKAQESPGYYAAYPDTIISCFPQDLRDALNTIANHYGAAVEITSGKRDRGRRHSLHRSCLAADIRVAGIGPNQLAAYAKTVANVNGVGTYRYNTVTHVDVRQEKMAWRY